MGPGSIHDGTLALPLHPKCWGGCATVYRQRSIDYGAGMLRWLARLVLYRFLGGRALAVLAILGFVRRLLGGRRPPRRVYQPSQGSSQMEQRDPR
jgi:hypothetical protein